MATTTKAVKQPQDHQKKEQKPKVTETTVTVGSREVEGWAVELHGVTVHVPKEALNDFELLDELGQMQSGEQRSVVSLPSMLRRLVGSEFRNVMTALKDPETGRVPVKAGTEFIMSLFKAINTNG